MNANDIDFLIIGAAKSATTWLQKSLQGVPGLVMPDPELHYFSRNHERGDDWYFAQFPPTEGARLVGEKSNSYLDDPRSARRVHAMLPHARLIVQLRNPVERAYSDYCMLYRRGEVDRNISHYLDARQASIGRFLENGLYQRQIEAYAQLYPTDRMLILFYEDMLAGPRQQLRIAGDFLGLAGAAIDPVRGRVKDRAEPMIPPGLRKVLRPFKSLIQPFRRHRTFKAIRRRLANEIAYPPLSADLRARLVDFYADDVARLGRYVRRDLSEWLGSPRQATPFE